MPSRRKLGATITDQWTQYIRASVTESAIDTFTQVTINLPVVVGQGLVMEALSVEWMLPIILVGEISATDDQLQHRVQLTKASQTALLDIEDPNIIALYHKHFWTVAARTAEGKPVLPTWRAGQEVQNFTHPILLPFEQIYLGAQTGGGSATKKYAVRIAYRTVRLATTQLVELIQAVT